MRIYSLRYLIIAIILLTPISAFAGHKGKWWKDKEIANKMHLTSQQVEQIEQIFEKHKEKLDKNRELLLEKEKQLNEKLKDAESNRAEINKLADEMDILKLVLKKNYRIMQLEIREILNPEQRNILYTIWSERRHGKYKK